MLEQDASGTERQKPRRNGASTAARRSYPFDKVTITFDKGIKNSFRLQQGDLCASSAGPGKEFLMVDQDSNFVGFESPNWTAVPNEIFDYCLAHLTGAEFKVLCYIARWTCGFRRPVAAISKDQMVNGYVTRTGKRIDHGAGVGWVALKSKNNVLDRLEAKGLITREREFGKGVKSQATRYSLNVLSGSPLAEIFDFPEPPPCETTDPRLGDDISGGMKPYPQDESEETRGYETIPPRGCKTIPPSEEKKERKKETTTTDPQDDTLPGTVSSGGSDSTNVEEPDSDFSYEDVYQPTEFSLTAKGAETYFKKAGSIEVLNKALRQVDENLGRAARGEFDKIKNLDGYIIGTVLNKRKEAELIGPAPDKPKLNPPDDSGPPLTDEEKALLKRVVEWIQRYGADNGEPPIEVGAVDFARQYIEEHGELPTTHPPDLKKLMVEAGYGDPETKEKAI